MATQVYHVKCWDQSQSKPIGSTQGMQSRFGGQTCSTCQLRINQGEMVTWNRRPNGATPVSDIVVPAKGPIPWKAPITPPVTPLTPTIARPTTPSTNGLGELLADAIIPYLDGKLNGLLNAEQVGRIVRQLAPDIITTVFDGMVFKTVNTVELKQPGEAVARDLGVQHKQFPLLLKAINARQSNGHHLNIWLTGPTGSGKTTSAKNAAEALGMRFGFCGAMDTSFQLLGYKDATGKVVETEFRDFYLNGGVYLLDEVDSWSPSALLALNGALANGECPFPDGTKPRHKDFVCPAAANTWGLGATNDYVGRCKLDAAFLARFVAKIHWDYDDALEIALCPNREWVTRVQKVRANAKARGLKVVISPRVSYEGAALLAAGISQSEVESITLAAGLSAQDWSNIR